MCCDLEPSSGSKVKAIVDLILLHYILLFLLWRIFFMNFPLTCCFKWLLHVLSKGAYYRHSKKVFDTHNITLTRFSLKLVDFQTISMYKILLHVPVFTCSIWIIDKEFKIFPTWVNICKMEARLFFYLYMKYIHGINAHLSWYFGTFTCTSQILSCNNVAYPSF